MDLRRFSRADVRQMTSRGRTFYAGALVMATIVQGPLWAPLQPKVLTVGRVMSVVASAVMAVVTVRCVGWLDSWQGPSGEARLAAAREQFARMKAEREARR